jgi:hypothetical protein
MSPIDHWLDRICFDSSHHFLKLHLGADVDASKGEYFVNRLQRVDRCHQSSHDANDRDGSLFPDGRNALLECSGATNFEDIVKAFVTSCQLLGCGAPVWSRPVVDDMVSSVATKYICFRVTGSRGDYLRAACFGKLVEKSVRP